MPATTTLNTYRDGFARYADHWAGLGVWCTLWHPGGQIISAIPQYSNFWKTLWNTGQWFRNELTQSVRHTPDSENVSTLCGVRGLLYNCTPILSPSHHTLILVCCWIDSACQWDEDFSRLCSKWQLDQELLKSWGQSHPLLSPEHAAHVLGLIRHDTDAMLTVSHQNDEAVEMTAQLADAYEELNLIYRVGSSMRVTQQPRDHFRQLFEDLGQTTPITTMAVVLYDTDILDPDNRIILGGEPIIDEPLVLKLAHNLRAPGFPHNNALVVNNIADYPQLDWANHWLERLIAVPIVCNEATLGVFLAINQGDDLDFDSTDVRLLHSVLDRSAAFLENVLLYGDLNKLLMGLLHALVSSIDAKDPYTCGHSNRVAVISKQIAQKCGMDPIQSQRVYLGGLLHDIGKIGISELILCKPGRLTSQEWTEMQRHPEIGAKILSGIRQLDDVIPGVLHHHEWLNGCGYPSKLAADNIPWIAKVIGLADAFDAMTTGRTYRNALPIGSVCLEIRRCAGTQFCPTLVDGLLELIDEGLYEELKKIHKAPAFDNVYTKWRRSDAIV